MGIKVRHNGQWVEFSTGTSSSGSGGGSGGSSDPVGTIVIWAGSAASIPTGYQLCDGGAAATSELEAITGTNVPDLTDRFVIGASNSTGDSTYPGLSPTATGGSANAVLIAHSHTHNRATYRTLASGGAHGAELSNVTNESTSTVGEDNAGNASTTQTGTNANLPPYYALCYIIKHTATSDSGGVGIGSTSKIIQGNTEAEVVDTGSDGHFKVTTEGTERLRVTPDGFVGIGSAMPAGVLDIHSTTGDANVFIRTLSNNLGNTQIVFGDSDENDSGKVQYNHPGDYMVFHTNSSEQVRITSNGSVGIGTTTPAGGQETDPLLATKLDVYKSFVGGGDGTFVGRFYGLDTDVEETSVRFITKGTGGTTADLHNASDAYLMHGISNGDTKFVFGANGNVGIGTTNPNDAVDSTNTSKLAVGIVTCNELYVNGTQITGSGSGGGGEPVGTIIAWGGSTASIPTGYQLCDGGAAESNALQAITGANVPDLTDRFIVGAGNNYAVDATGGSANATLPTHTHYAVRSGNVTTGGSGATGQNLSSSNYLSESHSSGGYTTYDLKGTGSGANIAKTSSAGSSSTNANLPPYYALCYIIKHTATSGSGGSGGGTSDVAKITAISAFLI